MYCKQIMNRVKSRIAYSNNRSFHSAAVASNPPPQAAGQMMQHSAAAADYFRDEQLVTCLAL